MKLPRIIRIIIFSGFGALIFKLAMEDKLAYYINKRYAPLALGVAVLLIILSVTALIFENSKNRLSPFAALIFIFPLSAGFTVDPKSFIPQERRNTAPVSRAPIADPSPQKPPDKLNFTEETYIEAIDKVYYSQISYVGTPITIRGKIFEYRTDAGAEYIVGRIIMACCAADTSVAGLLLESQGAALKENAWVEIEGILDTKLVLNNPTPFIRVSSIRSITPPKDEIIYLF